MAWRDELRPASFRGVEFHVDTSKLKFGRRLARHEYPQRDVPFMEDMGRKAREYTVEAFVLGDDYMQQRDALIRALEQAGSGQLVHPYLGTLSVKVAGDADMTESTREGGMAKFSIPFIESGEQDEPQAKTDTEAVLEEQYSASEEAFADDFAEDFSIDGAVDFVVDDALASTNSLLQLPSLDMGNLSWLRADPLSSLRALLPENLLASLSAPRTFALGILALVRNATDSLSLFGFSLPQSASNATPSRQAQNTNRAAIGNLVLQAATARRIVELGSSAPATLNDARVARAEIVARADAVLLADGAGQRAADALVQLRTDAVQHFGQQTASLPRLVSLKHQVVLPAMVIAHEFYGDNWQADGRDADLAGRNRIRHPGFVPAGRDIHLLSE